MSGPASTLIYVWVQVPLFFEKHSNLPIRVVTALDTNMK